MCLKLHFCALLVIISYRPGDDQFWIGCTMAEAERYFFPLLKMYGYAHEYRTPEIFLLYPLNAEMKKRGAIEFFGSDRSPIDGKRIHIKVFFVDLETILLKPELTRPCWLDQLIGKMDCF